MDTFSAICGIIGIVGCVITIIGLWYTWYIRDKKLLTYVVEKYYDLHDVSNLFLPHFKINYKGEELSDYIYVVEGYIQNSGNRDLGVLQHPSEFVFSLNRNCQIVDCVSYSLGATNVTDEVSGNSIKIRFDLMRKEKAIEYKIVFKSKEIIDESNWLASVDNNLPDVEIKESVSVDKERNERLWKGFCFAFPTSYLFTFLALFYRNEIDNAGLVYILLMEFFLLIIMLVHQLYKNK